MAPICSASSTALLYANSTEIPRNKQRHDLRDWGCRRKWLTAAAAAVRRCYFPFFSRALSISLSLCLSLTVRASLSLGVAPYTGRDRMRGRRQCTPVPMETSAHSSRITNSGCEREDEGFIHTAARMHTTQARTDRATIYRCIDI